MPKSNDQVSRQEKGTKKTTNPKRITNQMVWMEINKLNAQVSALGNQDPTKNFGNLIKQMDEKNQQVSLEISKLNAQLATLSSQAGTNNSQDLPKILSDLIKGISLINTQIAAIRDQLTELGNKVNTFGDQPHEPKPTQTKKWYEFWR